MLPVRSGASRPAAFDDISIARFSVHFLSNFYHAVFKQMTHISSSVFADSHGMQNKKRKNALKNELFLPLLRPPCHPEEHGDEGSRPQNGILPEHTLLHPGFFSATRFRMTGWIYAVILRSICDEGSRPQNAMFPKNALPPSAERWANAHAPPSVTPPCSIYTPSGAADIPSVSWNAVLPTAPALLVKPSDRNLRADRRDRALRVSRLIKNNRVLPFAPRSF